jgi:hypothetical protein
MISVHMADVQTPLPLGHQPACGRTGRLPEWINSERGPQDRLRRWEEPQPDKRSLVRLLSECLAVSDCGNRTQPQGKRALGIPLYNRLITDIK